MADTTAVKAPMKAMTAEELAAKAAELEEKEKKLDEKAEAKEKQKVEQAELDAYMDASNANSSERLTDDFRKGWLNERYELIKKEYQNLLMLREEAEYRKNDQVKSQVSGQFTENYKARKFCVSELRKMGEKVDDKFVPTSST